MDLKNVIADLRKERDRIDQAIAAIEGISGGRTGAGPGRRGRRRLSAAARKRISEGMRARWAERKKKARAA